MCTACLNTSSKPILCFDEPCIHPSTLPCETEILCVTYMYMYMYRVYQFLPENLESGDAFNVDINNDYVIKFAAEDTTGNVDQCEIRFRVLSKKTFEAYRVP